MKAKLVTMIRVAALAVLIATSVGVIPVYADTHCVNPGGTGGCSATIQAAIAAATDGDTINILPGTYTGTVDIDTHANLRLQGSGVGVTVLRPTSTLPWNIWGYAATRHVVIRIVNSTNIVIDGITLDMDVVKGDGIFGILAANSSGALSHSLLKNNQIPDTPPSPGTGYTEIGMRIEVRDAPYNDSNRALFSITDNTFQDGGRVAVNVHGWVNLTIARNTFMKSPGAADFGYGVELGSVSIGSITDNVFHGFDTPALSDGSTSAGLYIENAFTGSADGTWPFKTISPAVVAKNVTVANNEFYGNQYGVWIGNEYAGFAGNVDIAVAFNNNKIHNNLKSGVYVADEGRDAGSSVTLTGSGNQITSNEIGYEFFTYGNGEIHAALAKETITGNTGAGGDGIKVGYDTAIGTSLYDVSITQSKISGNSPHGIEAMTGIAVAATSNWWGSASGPGAGNNDVSGSVTTSPYAQALVSSVTASTHEAGEGGSLTTNVTVNGLYGTQLVVTHNPSILTFASGTKNDLTASGWYWDYVVKNFLASSGRTELSSSMQERVTSANLSNADLVVWRYTCNGTGTSALGYDTTVGTGSYLSDKEGFNIPAAWLGDSITCVAATASMNGTIQLQGRLQGAALPAGWNDATVTFTCTSGGCTGSGPYTFITGADGTYQLVKSGAGNGMALGTYSATATRRAYLGASKAGIVIAAGTNTISPTPKLLGGDVNNSGLIDLSDMAIIGGVYGTSVTPDTGADVNGDGFVNIFDLVLGGGNYNLSTSTW